MRLLTNEAALTEQESMLQNMRFQIEQARLNLRQQVLQMDYEIQRLKRQFDRSQQLYEKKLIADQEYLAVKDEYEYWIRRREVTEASFRQDSLAQTLRLGQMQEAVSRMRANFGLLQMTLENLTVRAPVAGHLTMLEAEIGEILNRGTRLGQIDMIDGGYKVRAGIDEFYIERVFRGQTASTQRLGGQEHRMEVMRVYPEVREGRFEVDLEFPGGQPEEVRRGQTIRLNLELGDPAEAVVVPRGGFYQSTGGNWIFVVDPSGDFAERRSIRLGRQNPTHYEVLEGLTPAELVVTSSYETFGDADRLVFE
jgi:HlyD family secretion protein